MNKILEIKFGSHLYGTDTENSDLDLKGIYLPTAREIVLGNYKPTISTTRPKQPFERNKKDDVDVEIFSLDRFLQLLAQGQVVALDMLFGYKETCTSYTDHGISIMRTIFDNRDKLLSKNLNAFTGYAKQQAAKYGQKGFRVAALRETLEWLKSFEKYDTLGECNPASFVTQLKNDHVLVTQCKGPNGQMADHLEVCSKKYPFHASVKYVLGQVQRRFDEYGQRALMAEKNEGVDWKALSHAVRVNSEAKELLLTSFITFPRPDRELLLKIKTGQMDYSEVALIIENGLDDLILAQGQSSLRDTPDQQWIDQFVFDVYKDIVCQN